MVYLVAELAGKLRLALILNERLQLLPAHADEGPGDPVPGAVASVFHRLFGQHLQLEGREHPLHQAPGGLAVAHGLGDGANLGDALLDGGDDAVVGAGQQLDQVAPGAQHALVHVHQYPQGAGGGDLLTLGEVGGHVLGDLTGDQGDGAHVGLLQVHVLNDGERAVLAYGGPHVQLGRPLQGQVHQGVDHIASGIAGAVGYHGDPPQGAVPLDTECHRAVILLELIAHHGGGHEAAAQGGGSHRQGVMDLSGPLHHGFGRDGRSLYRSVFGQ